MTALHLPPGAVDALPWFEVADLLASWADVPPANEALMGVVAIMKAVFGVSSPSPPPQAAENGNADDPSGVGALVAMFPSGFVPADR